MSGAKAIRIFSIFAGLLGLMLFLLDRSKDASQHQSSRIIKSIESDLINIVLEEKHDHHRVVVRPQKGYIVNQGPWRLTPNHADQAVLEPSSLSKSEVVFEKKMSTSSRACELAAYVCDEQKLRCYFPTVKISEC